jgi:hypothetical protein
MDNVCFAGVKGARGAQPLPDWLCLGCHTGFPRAKASCDDTAEHIASLAKPTCV